MKSSIVAVLLLSAVLFLPSAAAANDAQSAQREQRARQMWSELNLTPEQESKFGEINAKYAPVRREHAKRMDDLRLKINQELQKDRPSRSLLAQYAGQMGEHQKKMNIASVDHMLEVKAVLTPEQYKIFSDRASIGGVSRSQRGGAREPQEED